MTEINQVCGDCRGFGQQMEDKLISKTDKPDDMTVITQIIQCRTCGGTGWVSGGAR